MPHVFQAVKHALKLFLLGFKNSLCGVDMVLFALF
jgi:hypothetical protein